MDELDLFVVRGLRRLFEVQLAADRDAEHRISAALALRHQRFEDLLRRHADALGCMHAVEVIFVDCVLFRPVRDLRCVQQAHHIGFCHLKHLFPRHYT